MPCKVAKEMTIDFLSVRLPVFSWHPCPTPLTRAGYSVSHKDPWNYLFKVFKGVHSADERLLPGARWSPSVLSLSALAPSNAVCGLPGAQIFPSDDFKWLWHCLQEVPMLLDLLWSPVTTSFGLCNAMVHCTPSSNTSESRRDSSLLFL